MRGAGQLFNVYSVTVQVYKRYTYRYSTALALRNRAKSHTKKGKVRAWQRGLTKNVAGRQE